MMEAINWLTSTITVMNRVRQAVTATSTNVSNEETLLENQNVFNAHLRTQPKNEMTSVFM